MFGVCDLWEIEGRGALSLRHEHKVEKRQSKQEKEKKKTYGNGGVREWLLGELGQGIGLTLGCTVLFEHSVTCKAQGWADSEVI